MVKQQEKNLLYLAIENLSVSNYNNFQTEALLMPRSLVEAFPGSLRKDIAEEEV
jgi:hypothetical protein